MKLARVIAIIVPHAKDETSRGQWLRVRETMLDGASTDAEYVVLNAAGATLDDMVLLEEISAIPQYRATEIVQSIETLAREATNRGAARGRIA